MNAEDSSGIRRSRHSYSNVPEPPHSRLPNTHSFLRNFKTDGVATRSPFSKLTNSSHNTQTSLKKSQQYSESAIQSPALGLLRSNSAAFLPQPAPSGRIALHNDVALNQDLQTLHDSSVFQDRSCDNETTAFKLERDDISDIGEEFIKEPSVRAYSSSIASRMPQHLPKKETDGFSDPLQAEMIFHQASRISLQDKTPAYHSATPYRYDGQADDDGDDADQRRSNDARLMSQGIKTQSIYSRGSPAAVSTREQPADDLSTLLFKGATDLRNTNLALEEKNKAIQRLQEEVDIVTAEKKGLLKQIGLVKEKAKAGLESYAKQLDDVNNELRSLKTQSQEFFSFAQQATTCMADVRELREAVKKSTDQLGSYSEGNGIYAPTQGWKSALSELQTDLSNKQQVIDMFRDRLEFTQGELAEAKNRIVELEGIQTRNTNTLQMTSRQLGDAGTNITELASLLRTQQHNNTDILTKNSELETRLDSLLNDNAELRNRLSQKEIEIETLTRLQREHEHIQSLLTDRDRQIEVLHGIKDRLAGTEMLLKDRESKIQLLETSLEMRDKTIEALRKSVLSAEAETANQSSLSQHLKKELHASRTQLQNEYEFRAKILTENEALRSREDTSAAEARSVKKDLEDYKMKSRQCETRYEALQERFEDHAMMLRMEKKSHGDVQERLLAAEAAYAETIEDLKRNTLAQTNGLKVQISKLECLLHDGQEELDSKAQEYARTLSDVEVKYAQRTREVEETLAAQSEEVMRLQKELDASKNDADSLRSMVKSLDSDYTNLQSELSEARRPSQLHVEEITRLKIEVDHLRQANEAQTRRAAAIVSRYEIGDLSAEEKRLIDAAHRASQTAHEQQLVVKGNEIRQRDNMIKTLEKRKTELESQLARVLNTQARTKAKANSADGGRSLIDLDGWASSQASTSPIDGKPPLKALDRDCLAIMEDANYDPKDAVSTLQAKDTTTLISKSYQSRRVNFSPPQHVSFSRLSEQASELADEIPVFDADIALADVVAPKRKRAQPVAVDEYSEKARPLRRTKTVTRSKSRTYDDAETDALTKDPAVAPKVKARKRR